ncbi:uncharacterized protein LOC110025631 [Phalaenopsis equestris]|uniref:uncharacterized protein LOC110025631 n=1 Tax=Phalaenopsis equestris TaxID=78828 RepID=UPI0009E557DA|nr:uncharacterized protein LOC110025631 [Phalaenopsis equestris]
MFGNTRDRCYRLHPPVKRKQSSLKEIAPIQLPGVNEDGLQDEAQNSPTSFISITPPPPKEVLREEPNIITIISPTVHSFEERLQDPIQEQQLHHVIEGEKNIRNTALAELPHQGPLDTWRRGKLFERIDRFLVNQAWLDTNFMTTISHLPYTCSDHRPLLISISPNIVAPLPSLFGYMFPPSLLGLNYGKFKKKVAKLLKAWNWNCFGNFTAKVEEVEAAVKQTKLNIQMGLSDEQNLILANVNLLQAIHWEEEFYKQKVAIKKFVDGDRNTKFDHACIKQRRHSNTILKIKNHNGIWVQGTDLIHRDAIDHFQNLLSEPHKATLLNFDPNLLNDKFSDIHCLDLTFIPTEEEIWKALCSIDGDKVAGADGFTSTFYIKLGR